MKIPTPIHGWRIFIGEVGVIVLGILLALGAQQAVEEVQIQRDVRAFRETIDQEIGFNLFALDLRARQIPCDKRQVADMKAWLGQSRSGTPMPALYPHGPLVSSPYVGAWNSRDVETYRKLPADVRQKYAMFYDGLANLENLMEKQVGYWTYLARFSEPGQLSLEERRSAFPVIKYLGIFIALDGANIAALHQLAADLEIEPIVPQDLSPDLMRTVMVCRPVLEAPSAT